MLFDSLALGATYIWMCCGALVLFGVAFLFVILWVASKRFRQPEETEQPEQSEDERLSEQPES
jgi:hypothetical protein